MHNTPHSYGAVARTFHWLTALLILTAIPLGLYAESLPYDTSTALARKAQLFSLHKTLGVAAFFLAAGRILWALTQPRPAPLHPHRRTETLAAELVHWMLYISLLAVPLTGWVHHAATTGFAPILWPFGDNLPFVPKSEPVAEVASGMHWLFTKLMIASIALHILGALKHAVIDRDGTLSRMAFGTPAGSEAGHPRAPMLVAFTLFALGTAAAVSLSAPPQTLTETAPAPQADAPAPAAAGNWQVEAGTLAFTVIQMGSEVQGHFPDWQAEITFDPAATTGNRVRVAIDTTTLELGAVTDQARGPEFFDVAIHKQAVFEAEILPASTGYEAKGTLTLHGVTVPVSLPFTLTLVPDTAQMTGSTTLDRRDFGMGTAYTDESSVGFSVRVDASLSARRR